MPRSGDHGSWVLAGSRRCGKPQLQVNAAQGVFGALTDFYTLAIPLTLVLRLQLSPARKAGIFGIFLTGLLWVLLMLSIMAGPLLIIPVKGVCLVRGWCCFQVPSS